MLRILENWRATLAQWQERRQAYAELASLDDRSLADIGLTRAEIPYALSGATLTDGDLAEVEAPANGNLQRAA